MMHFCRSHLRIYLICSLSGFGNNCHSVTGCHRPAAVCSEDCHHPLLHSTHHLWRHSQSGPACQQYVHLLHVSKHRFILSRQVFLTRFFSIVEPQQVVSGEEGINLEEIREFAKNFKIRRLSLGLTQTQVGQALTATEGPAYSQSAICR